MGWLLERCTDSGRALPIPLDMALGGLPIPWGVATVGYPAFRRAAYLLGSSCGKMSGPGGDTRPLKWLGVGLPSTGEREHMRECLDRGGWQWGGAGNLKERLWAQHPALGTPLGGMPIPWGISRGLPTLCGVAVEEGSRECFTLKGVYPRGDSSAGGAEGSAYPPLGTLTGRMPIPGAVCGGAAGAAGVG